LAGQQFSAENASNRVDLAIFAKIFAKKMKQI
jgi:hypothetical protein